MKKLILTAIILSLSAAPALAHCGGCGTGGEKGSHSGDWMSKKMEKMTNELGLSEEQAMKVEELIKEKKAKKKAIKEEFNEKMKALLSEEQMEKYEAMKGKKGSHGHHKGSMKDKMDKKGSDHDHDHGDHEGHDH